MNQFMAEFGQGYVQTDVMSENNAVKYKLSIAGSCAKSTVRPYVQFQDAAFGSQIFANGINVIEVDAANRTIVSTKNYVFTETDSSVNRAFITYMDALPNDRLIIIVSEGSFKTDDTLCEWFKNHSSASWPTKWQLSTFTASYSAFYLSNKKVIVTEHVLFNDGVTVENVSTPLEVVFDTVGDIGATGIPLRIVEDFNETSNSNGNTQIIRYPVDTELTSPMSQYNISPGDILLLKCQLYANAALTAIGTTRVSVRWFTDTVMISNSNIDFNALFPDRWQTFERELTVPANANMFTISVSKTASPAGSIGSVKNFILAEMTRGEAAMSTDSEFGVNGIRMNRANDNNSTTDLLQLKDYTEDDRGIVKAAEFREVQY